MADKKTDHIPFSFRAPVVAVLGHVDHGKTTLLDAIRKSNKAAGEHGGITQAIGAYQIEIDTKEGRKKLTFIDTPGHEAFAKMRGRGVLASDIVILVVSSDDGVMPQTKESIAHIKAAQVPFIVAITKSDSPAANPAKVKQQLAAEGIELEEFGGAVPAIAVSAKTGSNIHELLELILLVFAMNNEDALKESRSFEGVTIEAKKDQKRGILATVIIQYGSIAVGDEIVSDSVEGKVRALITDTGTSVKQADAGMPIEILGFQDIPSIGAKVVKKKDAALVVPQQALVKENQALAAGPLPPDTKRLPMILRADTQGSLEAIMQSLPLNDVEILLSATGEPTEADILLARASGSIVIGFNVRVPSSVSKLAENDGVLVRTFKLIYELITELTEAIEMYKEGKPQEIVLGQAIIQAIFPFDKKQVAGSKVLAGRIAKGDRVYIERGEERIGETRVVSLRVGKDDIGKVEEGGECGILFSNQLDFQPQDVILSVR